MLRVFRTQKHEPKAKYNARGGRENLKLERTRGAGAPEALGRETAEEQFRLRRN